MKKNKQKSPYTFERRQKHVKTLLLSLAIPIIIAHCFAPLWVSLVTVADILTLVWAIKKPVKESADEENISNN